MLKADACSIRQTLSVKIIIIVVGKRSLFLASTSLFPKFHFSRLIELQKTMNETVYFNKINQMLKLENSRLHFAKKNLMEALCLVLIFLFCRYLNTFFVIRNLIVMDMSSIYILQ